ncbi:unnamed protein product [Peronospora belbahrii]|uniref:RxLR effector protein n=1 Tax=Peronospora belbahrii TaxID=622444 RepID=A0ABN8CLX4_9STRA|nr:unnamed protein product [Peronospora belbahrii]
MKISHVIALAAAVAASVAVPTAAELGLTTQVKSTSLLYKLQVGRRLGTSLRGSAEQVDQYSPSYSAEQNDSSHGSLDQQGTKDIADSKSASKDSERGEAEDDKKNGKEAKMVEDDKKEYGEKKEGSDTATKISTTNDST